jgi:ribonucleoside-diphosphate reductase alpha chain
MADRNLLPPKRRTETVKRKVDGFTLHISVGFYPDGSVGEVFVNSSKEGTQMRELLRSLSMVMSIALQHGVPLGEVLDAIEDKHTSTVGDAISSAIKEISNEPRTD